MAAFLVPSLLERKQKWHNDYHMEALRRLPAGIGIITLGTAGLGILVLSVLIMLSTSPVKLGPAGVTLWFLLVFAGLTAASTGTLYAAKRYLQLHGNPSSRLRYSWRQGLLFSGIAVCLLGLSSLEQLTWRDGILFVLFAVLIELYTRLRWP
jgi:hypothetical protein